MTTTATTAVNEFWADFQQKIAAAEARPRLQCARCKQHNVLDARGLFPHDDHCDTCRTVVEQHESKREAVRRFRERQSASGLPAEFHDLRLSDYDPTFRCSDHLIVAQRQNLLNYLQQFPKANTLGAFIIGPAGTGKTHLTAALCNRFCYHGYTPRWLDGRELDHMITSEWGKTSRERFFQTRLAEEIAQHEVIFIEDLQIPSAAPPGWYVNALGDILNQITVRKRLLFVTTNHRRRAELIMHNGEPVRGQQRELYLEKAYGESFTSRLAGLCKFFPLTGPDLRIPA